MVFKKLFAPRRRGGPPDDASVDERSPLLHPLHANGASSSSFENGGRYMAMPHAASAMTPASQTSTDDRGGGAQFSPLAHAERALGALLHGVLLYALCAIVGLLLVSLNFEGVLGTRVNWWLVFGPFWLGNVVLVGAHVASIRHAKQLRRWAELDAMASEPLLPLLRRIVLIYAVSVPLGLLLLWSQVAFCARLQGDPGTSLYVSYAPLLVLEAAFVVRYLLCRADSTLPGISWALAFVFTLLLAYQTNSQRQHLQPMLTEPPRAAGSQVDDDGPQRVPHGLGHGLGPAPALSWWTVAAPLLVFEGLMALALGAVLYNEFTGVYRLTRWQLGASALYLLALVAATTGELMLLEHLDYHWGTVTFPSALLFLGLGSASVALYVVGRHHVQTLMATKGGAVPVPLTRTSAGWITSHAVTEHWVLLGDVALTAEGLNYRNQTVAMLARRHSAADLAQGNAAPVWRRVWRHVRWLCGRAPRPESLTASDPERRIHNLVRRTSGSYSDIKVEVDTPKTMT